MRAKYEVSISHGSKVIAKVKVANRQTQTDKQTGQKQYAPNHSIRGIKSGRPFTQCNKGGIVYFKYTCKRVSMVRAKVVAEGRSCFSTRRF